MHRRWSKHKTELLGFVLGAAVVGSVAVAVALPSRNNDAAPNPPAAPSSPGPTPGPQTGPRSSDQLRSLGLPILTEASIQARSTHGRLRFVPAGTPAEWDSSFEPEAKVQAGEIPVRVSGVANLSGVADPLPGLVSPAGYRVAERGFTLKDAAGRRSFVSGGAVLTSETDARAVTVEYYKLRDATVVEVNVAEGSTVWAYPTAGKTEAFIQAVAPPGNFEQLLVSNFVNGDVYVRMYAPGMPVKALLELIDSMAKGGK